MSNRILTVDERKRRLLSYLEKISPTGEAEGVREELQAAGQPDVQEDRLDHLTEPDDEECRAFETLDVLIREGRDAGVEESDLDSLEAIIHKRERPAVNIVNDSFRTPPHPWRFMGEGDVRNRIATCIPSVGCIEVPDDPRGRPYAGTGFVVGNGLLITNRHVAEIFTTGLGQRRLAFRPGQASAIDFKREIVPDEQEPILLRVARVKMIHPYWDMALLEIDGLPARHVQLALSVKAPEDLAGRPIVVIGYPAQDSRSNLEVQNRIFGGVFEVKRLLPGKLTGRRAVLSFGRTVSAVTHDSSTLGGNSGSAVIDVETGHVVGLHFGGRYLDANFAVSPFDLAQDRRVVDAGVNFQGRLDTHGDFYGPIWRKADVGEAPSDPNSVSPAASVQSRDVDSSIRSNAALINATWTIPLQISVSIGTPSPVGWKMPLRPCGPLSATEGQFGGGDALAASYDRFSAPSLPASQFDWRTALSLALASKLSYEAASDVQDVVLNRWDLDFCEFLEKDETQCFVAASTGAAFVAFRGTESVGDWLGNLNVLHTTRSYGTVHRGFLAAFEVVESQLRAILAQVSGRPVLFTGHSLGGALATLAAAAWEGEFPISAVYTYGQPAVGRRNFQSFINRDYSGKFFRFVNENDIVARVPPSYRHVGSLYHLKSAGQVRITTESPQAEELLRGGVFYEPTEELPMLTDVEFDRLRAELLEERVRWQLPGQESLEAPMTEGLIPNVQDHSLDRYIAKLAEKA